MRTTRLKKLVASTLLALALPTIALPGLTSSAAAADYPTKQISLIVGAPPGGPFDLTARLIGDKLNAQFKQAIVIENRPGASGVVGFQAINKAAPDGYTIGMGATGLITLKFMLAAYNVDPVTGYTHIVEVSAAPLVVTVNAAQPYKSLAELIAYLKANPGKVNFGALPGAVAMDVSTFASMLGTTVNPIPYAGSAAQQQAIATGELPVAFDNFLIAKPFVDSGKTRLLGVVSSKRFPMFGDLPAIAEQVPGYEGTVNWFSVIGPPGMQNDVVTTLNRAINTAIREPDLRKRLMDGGQEVVGGSSEELRALVARETERMTKAAKQLGMQPQ